MELAVYVCSHVFENSRPVLLVTRSHGDWQYLCGGEHTTDDVERYVHLVKVLSRCSKLHQYDRPDEAEAETVAHASLDLEKAFRQFNEYLVELTKDDLADEQIYEKLLDIGEEFRHILYHLRDMHFYRYLPDE